jgi:putative membrane protein
MIMAKNSIFSWLTNGFKGMFIGMANAIPGVSGGTIAVITGIYEPIIDALGSVFSREGAWKKKIPAVLPLLIPVIIGVFTGIAVFANLLEYLFEQVPMQTQFLFIGLILGSLPFLIKQTGKTTFKPGYLIPLVLSFALLIWMAFKNADIGDRSSILASQQVIRDVSISNAFLLIFVGMIATGTMVVPGVSGSFLLVLIGMYGTFVHMFTEQNLPVIGFFMIGAILGLLIISKVISVLLEHFHGYTYYGIIGLVVGSVASLWPGFTFDFQGLTAVGAAALGFAAAWFLGSDRKAVRGGRTVDDKNDSSGVQE